MTKKLLLLVFTLLVTQQIFAQCNYTLPLYTFNWERNVSYGTAIRYEGSTVDLKVSICKPVGDNNLARPLLLWIHGGGFYPGTKESMEALCEYYAARGYVSATMSYRLGFYGSGFWSAPFAYDSIEVIRAAYRAIQDSHGALRFLKGRSVIDSTDVNLSFIGGASAGSMIAMHLTYADKIWEVPPAADSSISIQNAFNTILRPSLGSITGNLNLNGQNSEVKAVVNYFGALLDTSYVESGNDVPLFSYHQTGDPTVGCDYKKGLWGLPLGVGQNYPHLFGSCAMDPHILNAGYTPQHYQSYIHTGNVHGVHNIPLIDSLTAAFLSNRICELTTDVKSIATNQFEIFPNPANESFVMSMNNPQKEKVIAELFDGMGQRIFSEEVSENKLLIETKKFANGIYTVLVRNRFTFSSKKIIINH